MTGLHLRTRIENALATSHQTWRDSRSVALGTTIPFERLRQIQNNMQDAASPGRLLTSQETLDAAIGIGTDLDAFVQSMGYVSLPPILETFTAIEAAGRNTVAAFMTEVIPAVDLTATIETEGGLPTGYFTVPMVDLSVCPTYVAAHVELHNELIKFHGDAAGQEGLTAI